MFSSSGKKREETENLKPGPDLKVTQPGGRTDMLSDVFPLFYLMTKAESNFRNVVILLFRKQTTSERAILYIIMHHRQKHSNTGDHLN